MKGKKLFTVLLISVLSLSLIFTGCSNNQASNSSSGQQQAEDKYPEKPVTVLVGFAPGGGTDVAARLIFKYAEKYFGQSFAIVNKPGAVGEIAFTELATTKPDGYTIGFINPPTVILHPIQREGCKYTLDDFATIANIVSDPGVVAVSPNSPYNTLQELFDAAKEKKVSIGYSGPGSSEALTLRRFEEMGGFEFNKVPFEGSAPSITALMGGHIDGVAINVSEAYNHVLEGNLKLLAVGGEERDQTFPEVPTYKESGYDLTQISMRGVAAPAGLPQEYIDKLEEAVKKAVEDPEFIQKAKEMQMPLDYLNSDEYMERLKKMDADLRAQWEKSPW